MAALGCLTPDGTGTHRSRPGSRRTCGLEAAWPTLPGVDAPELAPRRARSADLAALVGWSAVFEAELRVGAAPERLTQRFRDRLVRSGLLELSADAAALQDCIDALNQRLRYVLGKYDDPPRDA